MNKLVDPLVLLKDFYINKKEVLYRSDDHMLVFGSTKVPVDAKTAWIKKVSSTQYTLGALWFFLEKKDMQIREYMIEADLNSFEKIHLLDKNKILEYFTGGASTVEEIDQTLINSTLIALGRTNRKAESSSSDLNQRDISKSIAEKREEKAKRKDEEEKKSFKENRLKSAHLSEEKKKELKIMEYLIKNEKRIVSKNSVLQCPGKSFAKIYSLCCEMINEKQKGESFLAKVKSKGVKDILRVNISTLKKKQKVSLLDEILHSGNPGD